MQFLLAYCVAMCNITDSVEPIELLLSGGLH